MGPFDSWYPYAGLALGLTAAAQGLLFQAGRLRHGARWYWDEDGAFYFRNAPFALLPFGVAFVAVTLGASVVSSDSPRVRSLGWALVALAAVAAAVGVVVAYRPPTFLKPEWLRREEATRGVPRTPPGFWRATEKAMVGLALVALAAGFAGAVWGAVSTAS